MAGTFELYRDPAGHYRFRLRSSRGTIIAVGEGFPTKAQAQAAIDQVRRLAPTADTTEAP